VSAISATQVSANLLIIAENARFHRPLRRTWRFKAQKIINKQPGGQKNEEERTEKCETEK
jgi:hypothetical protein